MPGKANGTCAAKQSSIPPARVPLIQECLHSWLRSTGRRTVRPANGASTMPGNRRPIGARRSLINHYYGSKDELLTSAYETMRQLDKEE